MHFDTEELTPTWILTYRRRALNTYSNPIN